VAETSAGVDVLQERPGMTDHGTEETINLAGKYRLAAV
jgi:hypothetical protein